jgi:Ran-binding protein 3
VPQTSESKFASSGFGKLAGASASPFGAPKGPSPFGAPATKSAFASSGTSAFGAHKDPSAPMQPSAFGASAGSAFGSGSGSSVFGTGSSKLVFGSAAKTGNVFGSPFAASKPGSSLGSFAGGSGPKIEGLSSKPSKPFGAAEESDEEPEEDDEDEDDEGHKSPTHVTDEAAAKKDKRFYEQDVETGEEEEKTLFTSRAKLFSFVKNADGTGAWKERGSGFIKVNVRDVEANEEDHEEIEAEKEEEGESRTKEEKLPSKAQKKKARFIMRANGTNRLVLNSPVEKHTPFGQPGGNGAKPTGKGIMFMGVLDSGAMQTLQLSVCWHMLFSH